MRILIADDEKEITKALEILLEYHKYSVDIVNNGEEALTYALSNAYDGIILDIMMPGISGLQVLQKLRKENCKTPILLLTAKDDMDTRITGLDFGADDYLTKPFSTAELMARLRAMLRRSENYVAEELSFGNVTLNCATYELRTPSGEKYLGNKEFQIMLLFLKNPKNIFSTDFIMEKVWGWECTSEINVVWSNITNLRRKLKSLKADIEIKSIRNVGYTLFETER